MAKATLTTSPGVPAWGSSLVHQNLYIQQQQQHPHSQQEQKNCGETTQHDFTCNSYYKKNTRNEQLNMNDTEILDFEMLQAMAKLDEQSFSLDAVNRFFDEIEDISRRLGRAKNQSHSTTIKTKNAVIDSTTKSTMIPIYYQNIRSVPAKENLYQNLQTTMYDIICFTETWFTASHKTQTYMEIHGTSIRS